MPAAPWGTFPPEFNVGLFESGTGPGTWLFNALQWRAAAALITEQQVILGAITADLLANWQGDSGPSVVAAFTPYENWLVEMQAVAMENATAADAVVSAYMAALGSMVPLPLISANRVAAKMAEATTQAATAAMAVPGAGVAAAGVAAQSAATSAELEAQYAGMWTTNGTSMTTHDAAVTGATIPKIPGLSPEIVISGVHGHVGTIGDAIRAFGGSDDIVSQVQSQVQGAAQQAQAFSGTPAGQFVTGAATPVANRAMMGPMMGPMAGGYGPTAGRQGTRNMSDSEFRQLLGQLGDGRGGVRSLGSMAGGNSPGARSAFSGGSGALSSSGTSRNPSGASLGVLNGSDVLPASAVFAGVPPTAPTIPPSPMGGSPMMHPPGTSGMGQKAKGNKGQRIVDEDSFYSLIDYVKGNDPLQVSEFVKSEDTVETPAEVQETAAVPTEK